MEAVLKPSYVLADLLMTLLFYFITTTLFSIYIFNLNSCSKDTIILTSKQLSRERHSAAKKTRYCHDECHG